MSATDALLQELQKTIGCQFMSDLHTSRHLMTAMQRVAVLSIPTERYSLQEWNCAVSYIIGQKISLSSVKEAKQKLLSEL